MTSASAAPTIGYFVHHQGRGHAERCAALAHTLSPSLSLRIFCARDDIFPALPAHASIERVPSLFEPRGDEAGGAAALHTPDTLHCAPVGWPGIRETMSRIAAWFGTDDPRLMICDVSAELAQLCRICSVPHVCVVQHGDRTDPGHRAAYDGAAGLLAPFDACLAQPDWDAARNARTFFAGGFGLPRQLPDRDDARQRLGLSPDREIVLVLSGGGGSGFASAPLGVGARAMPDALWLSIGRIDRDWHATEPENLEHRGWVDNPCDYIAAADLVVSSTGNTTCDQVLGFARPWLAVPEWRYFDEQHCKAAALERAGLATVAPHLPSSAHRWRETILRVREEHRPHLQRAAVHADAARRCARWIETLIVDLWEGGRHAAATASTA